MPRIALTDRFCSGARCPQAKLQEDFFDEKTAGLSLRVSARSVRSWCFNYTFSAKRRRLTLGSYPALSLATARARALEARGHLEADPPRDPRMLMGGADTQAMCVKDLADLFLARHVAGRALRSAKQIERRLNANILPHIGNVALKDLHRRDLSRVVDRIVARGSGSEANHTAVLLNHLCKWGADRGDLDVAIKVTKPCEEEARSRVLSDDELRRIWIALPQAIPSESVRRIIRLCIVLGQRSGEVSGMRKSELNLASALWCLPPERCKNGRAHSVPLPEMALAIIRAAIADTDGDRLFGAIKSDTTANYVRRAQSAFGLAPWTLHDARRTFGTGLERLGIRLEVAEALMNHTGEGKRGIRGIYRRYDWAVEKREAVNIWAERLRAIVSGEHIAEVIPLAAARG